MPVETSTSITLISCDGLSDYDWSDQAEEGPTNYALMAYSSLSSDSEVSNNSTCSKSCLETVKVFKSQYEQLLKRFEKYELMVVAYKTGEMTIGELRKKLKIVQKEKDGIQFNVDKLENASKSLNKIIVSQIVDNCKKGVVNEPTVKKSIVETSKAKSSADKPKVVRNNNGAPIIEDWVSDREEKDMPHAKKEKKTVKSSFAKIKFVKSKEQVKSPRKTTVKQGNPQIDLKDQGVIDSGCSRHMIGNMSYLTDFEEIDGGYVAFGGNPKRGKITGRDTIKTVVPAGSSSSVPAAYVSAGHVLVPADRDRIC
ncbi:hypothetical protein Tco_0570688 [Tanacetum coccineum]